MWEMGGEGERERAEQRVVMLHLKLIERGETSWIFPLNTKWNESIDQVDELN
jgi:hypothetical protein